ncbi:MAG: DNA polymerase I [Muribaculaceae bacterium]|nr:DNA polymerase I [Muribaculaceae bacterium]
MEEKKLFLLDAYALIYRAYYAMIRAPRITTAGFNTSAIFGFCNTLDEVLRKENPTHIAVCFDPSGPTFRHEAYQEYKAQRDKQPEDITASVPYIKRILDAYRIPAIEIEGYEADDVIGTLSRMAEKEGFTTYMMTPDKDYGQLVTDKVLMYRPSLRGEGFEIRGPKEVCSRYMIDTPSQVIDLLALEGDASDNIPGCPGVGEKTAAKLISAWGSVENLLAHTDDIKGALQKKIVDNAEAIRFSKYLVTIKTDVPLGDITPESLKRQPESIDELAAVYRELEFRTFLSRLGVSSKPAAAPKTEQPTLGGLFDMLDTEEDDTATATPLAEQPHTYRTLTTPAEVAAFVRTAAAAPITAVAVNSRGDSIMTARIDGLAICCKESDAAYIPLPADRERRQETAVALQPLFADARLIVSHDIKRTIITLRRENIALGAPYYDTSLAHYLLDPEMKHTLEHLTPKYLGFDLSSDPVPTGRQPRTPKELSPDEARDKLCREADVTLRLHAILSPLVLSSGLEPLLSSIELPLARVLADMEWTGVKIDAGELAALARGFSERLAAMEQQIFEIAGGTFNLSSPMQVGDVLFDRLKIDDKAKRTKKGGYSTTEEILEKLRDANPIVDLILKHRALKKLLTTYVNALPAMVNPATGKIHTSFNQTVTATGRISSTNPNLQNIPIRTDDGREIRRAFIAEPGDILLSADYSQIELRLMADMSGDEDMIEAFLSGADIHRATAAKVYHLPPEQVTETLRRNAKTANFGIIYGISAFGLSERLSIPRSEAKMLIDGYFKTYPGVKDYMNRSIEHAREQGYVSTIMGRKRLLPDINSRNAVVRGYAERNAINAPLQGSAADIIKLAMVNIHRHIIEAGLESRMILQVHDELVFNVKPDELGRLQEIVVRDMENAYSGRVPLTVSSGTGKNWLEAH